MDVPSPILCLLRVASVYAPHPTRYFGSKIALLLSKNTAQWDATVLPSPWERLFELQRKPTHPRSSTFDCGSVSLHTEAAPQPGSCLLVAVACMPLCADPQQAFHPQPMVVDPGKSARHPCRGSPGRGAPVPGRPRVRGGGLPGSTLAAAVGGGGHNGPEADRPRIHRVCGKGGGLNCVNRELFRRRCSHPHDG